MPINNSLYSFTWHADIVGDAGQALLPPLWLAIVGSYWPEKSLVMLSTTNEADGLRPPVIGVLMRLCVTAHCQAQHLRTSPEIRLFTAAIAAVGRRIKSPKPLVIRYIDRKLM